jgi:hypothetical protein
MPSAERASDKTAANQLVTFNDKNIHLAITRQMAVGCIKFISLKQKGLGPTRADLDGAEARHRCYETAVTRRGSYARRHAPWMRASSGCFRR